MTLREQCKQRLKVAFDSIRAISSSLTFILVVDDTALKVISSTIKMMQLINYGINSIQRLELKRKKFKNIQAVYMIHPDSYQLLLKDYNQSVQYGSIHILTLTKIPINILDSVSNCKNLAKRVKTLKQLNFNFVLYSDNQFIVEKAGKNYSKVSIDGEASQIQATISITVEELSTVVTSLSQFYIVEILYSAPTKSNMAEKISIGLKEKLEKMFDVYSKFNIQNYTSSAPQTTFLILDRSYDAITPLIRDFHYLPLLYDYKNCNKHKIEDRGKVYIMDDNDPIFQKFKNDHVSSTLTGLQQDFQVFSRQHVGAKLQKNQYGNMGIQKLAEVMKKIPQYSQLKEKYSFHMTAIGEIMNLFQKNNYKLSGQLQQNLASQTSQQGKSIKPSDLCAQTLKVLSQLKVQEDIVRDTLIALLTLQLKPKQKQSLLSEIKKSSKYSGIYQKMELLSGHILYKLPSRKNVKDIILDRHQPKIQETVRKISEGGQADLKYLRVGTQARGKSAQKSALTTLGRRKIGVTNDKVAKPRLIVFFCSAISYSEIRALSAYEKDYHIIYGSHSFTTQKQFLSLINSLQVDQL